MYYAINGQARPMFEDASHSTTCPSGLVVADVFKELEIVGGLTGRVTTSCSDTHLAATEYGVPICRACHQPNTRKRSLASLIRTFATNSGSARKSNTSSRQSCLSEARRDRRPPTLFFIRVPARRTCGARRQTSTTYLPEQSAMDTLKSMRVFLRVVEAESFTGAAQRLDMTVGHVSRAVSALELHLRARLLNRSTRRIALTEAGERYLQKCEQILAYVDQAEAEANDAQARPSGKLKIHAVAGFGQHYVIAAAGRYQERYPDVQIDLTLAQGMPDLLDGGYDVSLVLASDLPNSALVSQRLASVFSIVCASSTYLKKNGEPTRPAHLANHICLRLTTPNNPVGEWIFDGPNGQESIPLGKASFQVNTSEGMAVAIRESMGLALIPIYSAIEGIRRGEFEWVLPDYTSHEKTVFAVYSSRQYLDAKIRTWLDFLRDEIPATLAQDKLELRRFAHGQATGCDLHTGTSSEMAAQLAGLMPPRPRDNKDIRQPKNEGVSIDTVAPISMPRFAPSRPTGADPS
jgi:DNA-binding transcriptional LysR family regulator